MKTVNDVMQKYTAGEIELAEANEKLKELGAGISLDPEKNVLTEEEKRQTVVGYFPEQANGWGLLDTGTGFLDKVHVTDGVLDYAVNAILPDGSVSMLADVLICGKIYAVRGAQLT